MTCVYLIHINFCNKQEFSVHGVYDEKGIKYLLLDLEKEYDEDEDRFGDFNLEKDCDYKNAFDVLHKQGYYQIEVKTEVAKKYYDPGLRDFCYHENADICIIETSINNSINLLDYRAKFWII